MLGWLLVAAAIGVLPGHRADAPSPRTRPAPSLRTLQVVATAGVLAICLLLLRPVPALVVAAVTAPIVAVALARVQARPARARPSPSLALTLDLIAVGLHAGQPLDAALRHAVPAAGSAAAVLLQVAGLLRLGADPADAWRVAADDPVLAPAAAVARRSAASGIRLACAFERLAAELRAGLRSEAEARADRVGVYAAAPLGLCFLPSFVCLGIAPIVIGIAGGVLSGAS